MALKLYNELIDLDFMDYEETKENDLEVIQDCINCFGYEIAKELLTGFFD